MIPDKSATLTAVGVFLMFLSTFFAWSNEMSYTFLFFALAGLFFVMGWWADPNQSFGGYGKL